MADDGGFSVEDALDRLYSVRPDDFTALRTELAATARDAGDAEAAATIRGRRKPTMAAWVVNAFALSGSATPALTELGSRLRDAHSAMDGETIRALTTEQRTLVARLTREALRAADLAKPSAALRDDVAATLQAAVADSDVAARLGRLAKAEKWSGFGEFSVILTVSTRAKPKPKPKPVPEPKAKARARSTGDPRLRAALAAAERAKAEADGALSELQSDLAAARMRHQDARRRLDDADDALRAAEDAYQAGKSAGREAGDAVADAKARLKDSAG